MNEAIIRREIYQMLRYRYDLWVHHIPDVVGSKRPGIPDLIIMNPKGPGYYIEVKYLDISKDTSFAFSKIEESQRRFLFDWEKERVGGAYLAIGVYDKPRKLYIIPWLEWVFVEETTIPTQGSLPYFAGNSYSTRLQTKHIDFRLLKKWDCPHVKRGNKLPKESGWLLPEIIAQKMGVQE